MKAIWIIARKELTSFFDSLVAYVLLVVLLVVTGSFTWLFYVDVFLNKQVSLGPFFWIAQITLIFFVPALTMKMLAEEKRTGTIELLQTKSVSDWQIVLGKALGCLLLLLIAFLFTLPYYITLTRLGDADHGAILCGYLGLVLMSCAYIGIGMFTSSITNNQIVAFLLSLLIGLFLMYLFQALADVTSGLPANVFHYLSMSNHYDSMSRGVIDSKDVLYFVLLSAAGLVLAEHQLSKRNIAG